MERRERRDDEVNPLGAGERKLAELVDERELAGRAAEGEEARRRACVSARRGGEEGRRGGLEAAGCARVWWDGRQGATDGEMASQRGGM